MRLSLILFSLFFSVSSWSKSISATANRIPWSGYWWSMEKGELVLGWKDGKGRKLWRPSDVEKFDECITQTTSKCNDLIDEMAGKNGVQLSPLMKFDLYVRNEVFKSWGKDAPYWAFSHAARDELKIHYIGNNRDHTHWESRDFAGKCIGWALSTMDYDEPTEEKVLAEVKFTPADIKGILAVIYNGAQFFVPDKYFVGNPYYRQEINEDDPDFKDVNPDDFVRALFSTIAKGKMLEADLDPTYGVWNYPIHQFDLTWEKTAKSEVSVETTIYYADDEVDIDGVFTTNPKRPDIKTRTYTFTLKMPTNWNGKDLTKAIGGFWTGKSILNHPDALILGLERNWRTTIYDYKNSKMKKEVNFQLIKQGELGDMQEKGAIVDYLLEQYFR